MLEFVDVTRRFDGNKGIFNSSWQAKMNEITGIIGNNGCGKTTSLRIIANLQVIDKGNVLFEGKQLKWNDVTIVSEKRALYLDVSVYEHIRLMCKLNGMDDIEALIDEWLEMLEISEYKNTKIIELSKGNQQLVQIICGIIHTPKIILLDEPFNGLDILKTRLLIKLLHSLKKGRVILVAFHQHELEQLLCDSVVDISTRGDIK